VTRSPAENQPPIVGTPGVVTCVDHRNAARCHRDHESGRCICRPAENQQIVEAAPRFAENVALHEHDLLWLENVEDARAALRDLVAQAERNDGLVRAATEVTDVAMYIGECGDHPEHLMAAEHAVQRLAAALARLDGAR
jgi:hypothetical protein